ncbi:MAG: L,D-transpeptidase/peptidoglycan binding protein [Lachnospiraceae bacterium]|nr:L,D-transpeptidase/peptidoglycan binding protein [Lachnospiraceae bacterium]
MRKRTAILLAIVLVLLACVIGTYCAFGMYYTTHFLKNTSINGIDVSGLTASEAEELLAAEVEAYRLVVTGREEEQETVLGTDFDYCFVSNGETEALLMEQSAFAWIFACFSDGTSYSMDTSVTYDAEKLTAAVMEFSMMQTDQMVAPENAYVTQLEDGSYGIVAETEGTQLDTEKVLAAVETAVESGKKSLNLEMAECYVAADVTSADESLIEAVSLYNQYASMYINYYMSGDVVVTLDSSAFMDWFSLDEENNPSFDYASVAAWVEELADTYDTIGTCEPFVTSNGETVYVEAVTYGWKMDRESETEELYSLLLAGQTEGRSPVWTNSALTRGTNDVGDTYVEIDYTNQRMWYYKDGELLVETPVVTGNVSAGNASPEGMFYIVYKKQDAILTGETYETPVSYWMPFYGNVGIHDADSWRNTYGGTIYMTSGSHGCINTPTAQAQTIFENIEDGTPVICYSSSTDYGYGTASSGTSYVTNSSSGSSSGSDSGDDNIIIYDGSSSDSSGTSSSYTDTTGGGSTETNRIDDDDDSTSSDGTSTGEAEFEITISDETVWSDSSSSGSASEEEDGVIIIE